MPVEDIARKDWHTYFDRVAEKTTQNTANGLVKQLKSCLKFCKAKDLIRAIH